MKILMVSDQIMISVDKDEARLLMVALQISGSSEALIEEMERQLSICLDPETRATS